MQTEMEISNEIRLTVYDVLERKVTELIYEKFDAGNYQVEFDASEFPGGVYFFRLEADEFIDTKSMLLLK